ncbi:MAG: TauD/TfdA family dioxygenase, partial [Rhodospirillaceae bacterium]|nr:TauD/TfdA family dioxygenase [Rhodospirillaceae bacterium]
MPDLNQAPIEENNVWAASDLGDRDSWTRHFTPAMIGDVIQAVRAVGETPCHQITAKSFPLPSMAGFLDDVHEDLENGRAFTVLAGWPVDDFTYRENVAAYCVIAAQIGDIVVQNYEGQSVVDVVDEDVAYSHLSRGYRSNKHLPFHTDGADLTGLLCLGESASGGGTLLVSATKVFNTILTEKPEYLDVLNRGFYHHRRRQHDEGENPLSANRIPVFAFHGDYLHCCYNRNPIDWVEKEGMNLSGEDVEILDYFDSVVARPEMQAKLQIQKGDIQFFNNFAVLHSRTAYQDDADHRRHLVRLWL